MALLQGPQLRNASVLGFWMSQEEIFIHISTSSAFPFLFLSWPLSDLCLRDKCNTSLAALQTIVEVSDVRWCFSLLGEEKQKRRMERETCLA